MSIITSPFYCLSIGYTYIILTSIILYYSNFFHHNSFFSWGPPLELFGNKITRNSTFYFLLGLFFIHQIISKWITNIINPWIINTVQNPKCTTTGFTNFKTLSIISLFSIYNQFNLLFIVTSATSQVSFFIAIILANIISSIIINLKYLQRKYKTEDNDCMGQMIKKDDYGTFTVI